MLLRDGLRIFLLRLQSSLRFRYVMSLTGRYIPFFFHVTVALVLLALYVKVERFLEPVDSYSGAGENNDLTVLNNSLLFDNLLDDIAPVAPFEVKRVTFQNGYYLADGIYSRWASFVKSFMIARDEKCAIFKRRQEGARKDVERAFGVLQGR
ncbi:ALP1-like protein [Tanacetum coccineum]